MRDGREVYADTGRPVDERLGSHVVLWIVEDPEAWASAIEAEGDQVLAAWVKSGRKWRDHGEDQRSQRYKSAARVRADGPQRLFRSHFHRYENASASAAELRRSHPNPGVRYEVAEITGAKACPNCHTPMIEADQQWRHHLAGFPIDCHWGRPQQPVEEEPESVDGEWWVIDPGRGSMTCGYCKENVSWPEAIKFLRLTGYHLLGVDQVAGELVVLAEAQDPRYARAVVTHLPHRCSQIPDELRTTYAHLCAPDAIQGSTAPQEVCGDSIQ
ncbi:hypothetical protein [Mycobacteroides abscessus]|uniref:hypothetical protein n=1 Tax=Mycobacteroides abscessus TaxID=36809 RepID=UPI000695F47E|nr:hypothetical protein [Mycobacteroides abscessus]